MIDPRDSTSYGLTTARLEALSDGELAIVITLLVLSFATASQGIAGSPALSSRDVLAYLVGLWPHFLGYSLSFILIAIYCLLHHWMFHFIRRADHTLVWLNMLFLMSVSFLPFPTDLLAECILHESNVVVVFYGLSHAVAGSILAAMWLYATWGRRLTASELDGVTRRGVLQAILVAPALSAAGVATSFFSITAALVLYAAVPILYIAPTTLGRGTIGAARSCGADRSPRKTEATGTLPDHFSATAAKQL
jgi:uncharacterized membrane protein